MEKYAAIVLIAIMIVLSELAYSYLERFYFKKTFEYYMVCSMCSGIIGFILLLIYKFIFLRG